MKGVARPARVAVPWRWWGYMLRQASDCLMMISHSWHILPQLGDDAVSAQGAPLQLPEEILVPSIPDSSCYPLEGQLAPHATCGLHKKLKAAGGGGGRRNHTKRTQQTVSSGSAAIL